MKLSVLDQSPVSVGMTPALALQNSIELARLADQLGYERIWIAEHHGMATLASPAPEILMARIGAETSGIRIGSGAILLPHYSPLKVAEVFRMLHALYPNRIDLGIGRAPGGSSLEAHALRQDRDAQIQNDDFPERLSELLAYLHHLFPQNHPFRRIKVTPDMAGAPDVWLLGSSLWSASAAAQLGLPYAFAHFINPEPTREALEYYQHNFEPSQYRERPEAMVALGVVCADTQAEAERIFASTRLLIRKIRQGVATPVPAPEEAIKELGTGPDPYLAVVSDWPRYVVGTPERVREELSAMAKKAGIEELMVVTIVHDHQARLRSYELLAEAFGLQPRTTVEESVESPELV